MLINTQCFADTFNILVWSVGKFICHLAPNKHRFRLPSENSGSQQTINSLLDMYWPTVSCWNVTCWRCCESQKTFKTIRLHILGTMVILQNLSVVVAILSTTLIVKNVWYCIYLVFISTSYVGPSIAQLCNQYRMKVNVSCTLQCTVIGLTSSTQAKWWCYGSEKNWVTVFVFSLFGLIVLCM